MHTQYRVGCGVGRDRGGYQLGSINEIGEDPQVTETSNY